MIPTLMPVRPGLHRQMLDFFECHCHCHCHLPSLSTFQRFLFFLFFFLVALANLIASPARLCFTLCIPTLSSSARPHDHLNMCATKKNDRVDDVIPQHTVAKEQSCARRRFELPLPRCEVGITISECYCWHPSLGNRHTPNVKTV